MVYGLRAYFHPEPEERRALRPDRDDDPHSFAHGRFHRHFPERRAWTGPGDETADLVRRLAGERLVDGATIDRESV